jgi:hypothetical protein
VSPVGARMTDVLVTRVLETLDPHDLVLCVLRVLDRASALISIRIRINAEDWTRTQSTQSTGRSETPFAVANDTAIVSLREAA